MANKKKSKRVALDQSGGFQQSIGGMLNLKVSLPPSESKIDPTQEIVSPKSAAPWWSGQHQLKVYVSTKGFGGKKATICEGLPDADTDQKQGLSRVLSKRLGARSFWKGHRLCVQGDHVERLTLFFECQT